MKSTAPLRSVTFAYLDIETTGLSPRFGDRICEIAILKCLEGKALDSFQTLVNPGRPISPGASAINGITDSMVQGAPDFREIVPSLLGMLEGTAIVCHNAPFDIGFLVTQLRIHQFSLPNNPIVDTLVLARKCFNFPSNSLGNIVRHLGFTAENEHRAMGDVYMTRKILEAFLRDLRRERVTTLEELQTAQGYHLRLHEMEPQVIPLPPAIEEAFKAGRRIRLRYLSSFGNETDRIVEPLDVSIRHDYIYLVAFCHLRQDRRTFRLDRIAEMSLE